MNSISVHFKIQFILIKIQIAFSQQYSDHIMSMHKVCSEILQGLVKEDANMGIHPSQKVEPYISTVFDAHDWFFSSGSWDLEQSQLHCRHSSLLTLASGSLIERPKLGMLVYSEAFATRGCRSKPGITATLRGKFSWHSIGLGAETQMIAAMALP